ncbi:MAG TPA: hypothetical protein VH165_15185 [Kofleriaceae bacterium]|nr:hypothetical protein [Kofleriaceae bacterium]
MIRGWLVGTLLLVRSVTAPAQSARPATPPAVPPAVAPASTAASVMATDAAGAHLRDADQGVVQLTARRIQLNKRYLEQLDAIDRLKNQRPSWRRDRELRESLPGSLDTANQLSAVDREIKKATLQLLSAQRAYLSVIDAELAAGTTPVRGQQLQRARAPIAQLLEAAPRRIVIPDLEIDLLADPEELDQRAAELRASETELNRQLARLDQQAAELDHLAMLRKQHNRAGDLFTRDNDEPQRGATRKSTDTGTTAEEGTGDGRLPITSGTAPLGSTLPGASSESFIPTILADMVDASTIASFAAAERSTDPAQRAAAAHKAHAVVALQLEQVKQKRAEIEARSKRLRGQR